MNVRRRAGALGLAGAADMPAFVVGPPPVGDLPEADRRLAALSNELARLCAEDGVPFVATHAALQAAPAWQRETRGGDGSHPQTEDFRKLADLVIAGGFFNWLGATGRKA